MRTGTARRVPAGGSSPGATVCPGRAARVGAPRGSVQAEGGGLVADVTVCDESAPARGSGRRALPGCRSPRNSEESDEAQLAYGYRWQLQPRPGRSEGIRLGRAPDRAGRRCPCHQRIAAAGSTGELVVNERLRAVLDGVNRLCTSFIVAAFRELGFEFIPGDRFTDRRILRPDWDRRPLPTAHAPLLGNPVRGRHHSLRRRSVGRSARAPKRRSAANVADALLIKQPSFYAELMLVGRCGQQLGRRVLKGDVDPLHLIFPDGSLALAEQLYQDSPSLRSHNVLAHGSRRCSRTIPRGHAANPRNRRGHRWVDGLRAAEAPRRPHRVRLHRPVQPLLQQGRGEVRGLTRSSSTRSSISKSNPLEQDFEPHSFDVIIASQVLHAARESARRSSTCAATAVRAGHRAAARSGQADAVDRHGLQPDRRLVAVRRHRPAARTTRC